MSVRSSVRPSVCPSAVTRRYSVETVIHILILKIFTPSDSRAILVFAYQTVLQYSDEDPVMQGAYEKIAIFRQIVRFISETKEDRATHKMTWLRQ